jgi:hypothetical protein
MAGIEPTGRDFGDHADTQVAPAEILACFAQAETTITS